MIFLSGKNKDGFINENTKLVDTQTQLLPFLGKVLSNCEKKKNHMKLWNAFSLWAIQPVQI